MSFPQQAWREQEVVYGKNNDVRKQLAPYDKDIYQANMVLRHHLRVEDWHQERHRPHQKVEDIFAYTGFICVCSHTNKDTQKIYSLKKLRIFVNRTAKTQTL